MMRVVIVTGASSGIGHALAVAFGARGDAVVLSGRNEVALARVAREVVAAGGEAFIEPGDVTDDAHRTRLVARAVEEKGRLDLLVNNAGRGYYAKVMAVDPAELEALFALNVVAPLRLAQLAVPALAKTGGSIVMVSSIAGVVAAPRMGAYAASKFALEAIALSLRAEVKAQGVGVLVVRPGPVETPFRANAVTREGVAGVRPKAARVQTPEEIATLTLRALDRKRAVVETTPFVKVASFCARALPAPFRMISARMAR